jgi:hypothetical protein
MYTTRKPSKLDPFLCLYIDFVQVHSIYTPHERDPILCLYIDFVQVHSIYTPHERDPILCLYIDFVRLFSGRNPTGIVLVPIAVDLTRRHSRNILCEVVCIHDITVLDAVWMY